MICHVLFALTLGALFWMLRKLDSEDTEDDRIF